ncbi:hypothetical protein ACTWP5_27405 [Streptomyces sp. 4N509B]|uniref:hypothetical protein n=1 Tax=Streptomyces sp. 4N509B TaxID=3457413 RepID=UPI003FD627BE
MTDQTTTRLRPRLFGPADERTRPGYPDIEWSVWITGMDDIHELDEDGQPFDLLAALQFAAEYNAGAAADYDGHPYTPVIHAVVLHWGYAWSQKSEHAHGVDCGVQRCGPCSFDRDFPEVAAARKAARATAEEGASDAG